LPETANPRLKNIVLWLILPVKFLYQENLVIDVNVTGQVNGLATENFKVKQCGNEVSTGMPYARVFISGGNSAYADSLGAYYYNEQWLIGGYRGLDNARSLVQSIQSGRRGRFALHVSYASRSGEFYP
jgi:hypothetical protein